ncbi:MAG: aldo/keto reductase [Magnetococcales bacterium]|nr:aldo/keto reductase [Magnetococcales bacterium]
MTPNRMLTSACGVTVPPLLYGTAWKKERTAPLVEQALLLGFRGIDTACQPKHYHEAGVGQGVAAGLQRGLSRAELYLQTKFTPLSGQDPARIPYDPRATLSQQVAQSFRQSLLNLQTDYLDCLLLHSPLPTPSQTLEVWQAMEELVGNGGVKQLGISNCYDPALLAQVYDNSSIKPAVLQNRFYAATRYDREIRAYCREQAILYQGFWTLTANPGLLAHATLHDLAKTYQRSPEQIFYRYLSQIGVIPLIGTTSSLHMQEDLSIFAFELTASERDRVTLLL